MSHKPVTISITGGRTSTDQQEPSNTGRKCFKTLQHTATDKENLAGRPVKPLKESLTKEQVQELLELKRKKPSRKKSPPSVEDKITEDDLTNVAGPSENYWQILAEKRRIALEEALEENEQLCKIIEELKEKNALVQQMLDEANSFVEVFKEMVDDNNDTGIDVKDVSTANTTAEAGAVDLTADSAADFSSTNATRNSTINEDDLNDLEDSREEVGPKESKD